MTTLVQAWKDAQTRLKTAGVDSPAIDARLLLEAAAGVTRVEVVTDPYRELPDEAVRTLADYVERRSRREPVSRILGRKGFWKLMLAVTPDVLTPRPDTEVVVDLSLRHFPEAMRFSMLDIGTGSGAILLAVLAERPAAKGLGTDISDEALAVARDNAANLDLGGRAAFLRTSWADGLGDAGFDLVVSNPPYIRSAEIDLLDPEVRDHEPRLALDGGPDGLEAYRILAPEVMRLLKPGGMFAVETGWDQGPQVRDLFVAAGASQVEIVKDLGDRERVVTGLKNSLGNHPPTR
ncbi:MAG: peptide chain release factor N(5)-glutamine methyltransferase [Caulobacteraceae bacterium]|nr:peptide chain release factor N(5)-glutamine methyltransferase [Caulobacteraceae bacterium]